MEKLFPKLARYFLNPWQLGILDPQKGLWTVEPDLEKIALLKAKNAQGCHILIKPLAPAHYLMADDITPRRSSRITASPTDSGSPLE